MTLDTETAARPGATKAQAPAVRCRTIEPADDAGVAALLARGFPERGAAVWARALASIRSWESGRPVGYLLETDERPVGALLTIHSPDGSRCNMSSWYAEDEFRRFGSLLVNKAVRDRSLTYVNISSVRSTRPIIEAQGFRRYADGIVLGVPLLALPRGGVRVSHGEPPQGSSVAPGLAEMARAHRDMGCIVLWCTTGGEAHPFVMVRRRIGGRLTAAQVVYCPENCDWRRFAAPLGRALARHGLFLLAVDAEGPLPGLPGRFLKGRMPKYARGPNPPRLGDLTWTETPLFGA